MFVIHTRIINSFTGVKENRAFGFGSWFLGICCNMSESHLTQVENHSDE